MQVLVTPASITLQAGESKTVNFAVNVNNATTPNLSAQPFTYGGSVVATNSAGQSIHRPFALCKAPKLVVTTDDFLLDFLIFHGTDYPIFQYVAGQAPVEMLLPAGKYDFYFNNSTLFSAPFVFRAVVRENVDVSSFTALAITKAEAKNKLTLKPINSQGNALNPDWSMVNFYFTHRASKTPLGAGGFGFPLENSTTFYVSDVGTAFTWDADFGAVPGGKRDVVVGRPEAKARVVDRA